MNREFIRIADIDQDDEFFFIIHHPNHPLDQVINIWKLRPIS